MKICVRCKTENNPDYKYCKLCGAQLPCVDRKPLYNEEPFGEQTDIFKSSDEISTYEMEVFVGKNCKAIVPKFVELQRNNKRVSFCLPVLLLGLFFGFAGIAAYFLYRKMTKPAVIILAAATLLIAVETFINYEATYTYIRGIMDLIGDYVGSGGFMSEAQLNAKTEALALSYNDSLSGVFSTIKFYIGSIAAPIAASLFTNYIYKEHALKKISACKAEGRPDAEYLLFLHRRGGTSGGAVVVGLVVLSMVVLLVALVPIFAALSGF